MRIATWNVNSIRSRIDRLEAWLIRTQVDVLAIQETKCKEAQFPYSRLEALGYAVAHHGLNQWNGVALLSRVGLSDVQVGFPGAPQWGEPPIAEARAIGATVGSGEQAFGCGRCMSPMGGTSPIRIWPARSSGSTRYGRKRWTGRAFAPGRLVRQLDIAPRDEDVWSMAFYEDKSHVSPPERAAFQAFLDDGFVDVVRPRLGRGCTRTGIPAVALPETARDAINFVLGSPALASRVLGAAIDREERKGTGASNDRARSLSNSTADPFLDGYFRRANDGTHRQAALWRSFPLPAKRLHTDRHGSATDQRRARSAAPQHR